MAIFKKVFVLQLVLFLAAGCAGMERQKIEVDKLSDTGVYEEFEEITELKKVSIVKDIVHNADWENQKVDMAREADYRFTFQFMNPDIQAKAILYAVWIGPNKDSLEVVQGNNYYVHLNKEDSSTLFEAITETRLSDLEY